MTGKNNFPKPLNVVARYAVFFGLFLTAAGVLADFQLERHSFINAVDNESLLLQRLFFPLLILGLVTTLVGSILWAWNALIAHVALTGLGIVIVALLALEILPINIHGWTAMFLFVGVAAILIGGLFLILAGVRFVHQRYVRP